MHAGTSLAIHATKLLCENSPNADSLLALCSPPNSELELPVIVETAVDYLICSDPSCLEASALSAVLEPPTRPHLDYIRTARANEGFEFTDEGFLTSQEQAIQINAQLHGLQNGSCRHGGMGGRNGAAGRGAGLGNMGVRPARHRSKQEHTTVCYCLFLLGLASLHWLSSTAWMLEVVTQSSEGYLLPTLSSSHRFECSIRAARSYSNWKTL